MTEIEQKVSRNRKSAQKLQKHFYTLAHESNGAGREGGIPKQAMYIYYRYITANDAADHDVTMYVTTGDVVTINITSSESVLA